MTNIKYTAYFHNGTMDGDCDEASLIIDSPNITFAKLKKMLLSSDGAIQNGWAKNVKDEDSILDFIECNDDVVGAWIVSNEFNKKFKIIDNACELPGNDSSAYELQALWKGIYKAFAIKELGKKAK